MSPDNLVGYGVTQIEQRFRAVKDKPLEVGEVLPFVTSANPDSLDDQITWYGAGYPNTPMSQYHRALETEFPTLPNEEKARVLSKGLRFATLDFTRSTSETVDIYGGTTYQYQFYAAGAFKAQGQDYLSNFSAYLLAVLEYTGGDLRAAQEIITSAPYSGSVYTRRTTGTIASFLYRSTNVDRSYDKDKNTVFKGHQIKSRFQTAHPKARALAFITDAYLGNFNIDGINADLNLEKVLNENDPALITQVLVYLREQLTEGEPGYGKTHAIIAKVLGHKKHLYETVKERFPGSQFVTEYEAIQNQLRLRRLESKIADGRIHPQDLVEILTTSPGLLEQVEIKELYDALDATNSHGVAVKIEQLIQAKKDQLNSAS